MTTRSDARLTEAGWRIAREHVATIARLRAQLAASEAARSRAELERDLLRERLREAAPDPDVSSVAPTNEPR